MRGDHRPGPCGKDIVQAAHREVADIQENTLFAHPVHQAEAEAAQAHSGSRARAFGKAVGLVPGHGKRADSQIVKRLKTGKPGVNVAAAFKVKKDPQAAAFKGMSKIR